MIDLTDPAVATDLITPADASGASDAAFDDDLSIFVDWTAGTDAGSGVASYTLKIFQQSSCGGSALSDITGLTGTSYNYTAPSEATYSFRLVTFDNAGNQSVASACSTDITIDLTSPTAVSGLKTPADNATDGDALFDDDIPSTLLGTLQMMAQVLECNLIHSKDTTKQVVGEHRLIPQA